MHLRLAILGIAGEELDGAGRSKPSFASGAWVASLGSSLTSTTAL
ncbi:MAG: hypothetical protein VW644_00405 [Alphaproteobacteria bacterium]